MKAKQPLHIVHVVHRFDYGGLENGLVNLINTMDAGIGRHTIIALTEATDIAKRLSRSSVTVLALGKKPGKDPYTYIRLFRFLRRERPDVFHTRNLGTLDCQFFAWMAGVPVRIHGEHGWDTHDPDGTRRRYRWMRKALIPFVGKVIALSGELERWLVQSVGVSRGKVARITNGVDCERFQPAVRPHVPGGTLCIGSVTRFSPIKDPLNILRAFKVLRELRAGDSSRLRLLMVGDGALMDEAKAFVEANQLKGVVEFSGETLDVLPWLSRMDIYVLGSRREGISNTILEAMAMGLPVVATHVGGNAELVSAGNTGELVPAENHQLLAEALAAYVDDPARIRDHGRHARLRAEREFSLQSMTNAYASMYLDLAYTRIGAEG